MTKSAEPPCGTVAAYRHGCRCGACRAEKSAANRAMRARPARDDGHGTKLNFARGCRCVLCSAAGQPSGRPRSRADHGVYGYRRRGCRCARCVSANGRSTKVKNDASRDMAFNHGKEWTGPEMETAARPDLSAAEVAALLGRSVYAVRTMRSLIENGDPRKVALLGKLYR